MAVAFGRSQSVLSEEALKEKHANRTGELNGLPSEVESSIIDPTSECKINEYIYYEYLLLDAFSMIK